MSLKKLKKLLKNKENIIMNKNICKNNEDELIMMRIFDKEFVFNYNIYFNKRTFENNSEKITQFIDILLDNGYKIYSKDFEYETPPNKNFKEFKEHFNKIAEIFHKVFGEELELKI